tara:strand:+ start:1496 stop:2203 length:708 start_codon:yes stop_codon:yes gene_type:complete
MSTLKVNTIKPITNDADLSLQGDSSGSAVDCLNIDSSGDIDFSGNTDAKIKLPSAGGIYESDGSTKILAESGGAVTLENTTLSTGTFLTTSTTFPAGHILQSVSASITNLSTSAYTGRTGVMDVQNQITVSTSNAVLINWQTTVYADRGTDAGVYCEIAEGTVSSLSSALSTFIAMASAGNTWFSITGWAYDPTPASTTPSYVFTIQRNTSGTNNVYLTSSSNQINQCRLFEVKL